MTEFGLGTYAYAWAIGVPGYAVDVPMDANAFLQRAAGLGFCLVQIADNLPLDRLSAAEFQAFLEQAEQLNIGIEVGTRGIEPDHLRRYLAIAQACKSPLLRVVVDTAAHHPDPDEIVERLRAVLPGFEHAGIVLAIENHDRFKAATLASIVQALDSDHAGICLDTVNSFGALEGPDVVIETLGKFVVNLHIKDFVIRRADHNMGFVVSGTPAGDGMLNVPGVVEQLHSYGRRFSTILELWPPPEPTMAATIAKEDAWTRRSATYLRSVLTTL